MRVGTGLPVGRLDRPEEFVTPDAIAEIATAAERAGFDSTGVSEHPFPDDDWLRDGNGHQDLDPFVTLSFAAAATTTIRLRTNLLVLPYRNPFVTARSVATLDHLSGGRVVLGVGTGYLEREFRALGVDFDERNELTDEAIVAMRRAWTEEGVQMKGLHFEATGNTMLPRPVQPGGPPIWIGGNSKRAIRRAVELADGWMPMPYAGNPVVSRRTPALQTLDDLKARLAYAREHAERVGREEPLGVSFPLQVAVPAGATDEVDALVEAAEQLAGLGITETGAGVGAADTRAVHLEGLARVGEELLPRLHAVATTGVRP